MRCSLKLRRSLNKQIITLSQHVQIKPSHTDSGIPVKEVYTGGDVLKTIIPYPDNTLHTWRTTYHVQG